MRLLATGASGLQAEQLALDTAADNIANVNTYGFKSHQPDFAETLAENMSASAAAPGEELVTPIQAGAGVAVRSTLLDVGQGNLIQTGNQFDLAINGSGFFQVYSVPGNQLNYTRTGTFQLSSTPVAGGGAIGSLLNPANNTRLRIEANSNGGPAVALGQFFIPPGASDVSVSRDGNITATVKRQGRLVNLVLGRINLAGFPNPENLNAIGGSLFDNPNNQAGVVQVFAPGAANGVSIEAGMVEGSNVDLTTEMTQLIQAQRAYQANARSVQTGDQMWGIANSIRR